MAQYIDKSVLVAEIERRKESCAKQREDMLDVQCYFLADFESARMGELNCIKDFLDTLEVKEVDLSKEIDNYFDNYKIAKKEECWLNHEQAHIFAKHFFELGIKEQKEK